MNPIRSVREYFRSRRMATALGVDRRSIWGTGAVPAAPVLSGTFVTPETALSLAAVYACVNVISRDCAIMPRNVYKQIAGGGKTVATDHPAHNLVRWQPNDDIDAMRYFQASLGHVLTHGNGYSEIVHDPGDGSPQSLQILDPRKTLPKRTKSGALYYELDGNPNNRLAPENVLHFAGMGFDGLVGYSPITVARQTIGLGIAAEQFGASFFGNGAIPKGILKHPKRLGEAAASNLRNTFYKVHQGSQNAHNLAVLEEGMDWVNTQVSPEDSQFLQTREFQVKDIARIYSIPPSKIGDMSGIKGNSLEENNLEYIVTTLHGWIAMMEYQLNLKLLTPKDRRKYSISFDMSAMMRGNTGARTAYYQTMRNLGAISADEIRDMEGLNPIGPDRGGDLYIVQGQYLPLEEVTKQPDPAGPSVDDDPNDDTMRSLQRRFNPNHDPANGEFSDGSGGSGNPTESPKSPGHSGSGGGVVAEKTLSEKALRAQQNYKKANAAEQRYAEAQEVDFAGRVGGTSLPDNEPIDVHVQSGAKEHGIELKTIVSGKNDKITMKASAVERKVAWEKALPDRTMHTVVLDHRNRFNNGENSGIYSGNEIYYKRGVGAFRIGSMHKVADHAELKRLLDTPSDKLPAAAKGPNR